MNISVGGIYLETTSICNLRCTYCYHGNNIYNHDNSISIDVYKSLIEELVVLGVKDIELSGGEPLLHPYILEMMKIAKENKLFVKLITNGTLINKYDINDLEYADEISISIDGINSNDHDRIRGQGSFVLLRNGIEAMRRWHILHKVVLCITLNRTNYKKINTFLVFAINLGVKGINFNLMHESPHNQNSFIHDQVLEQDDIIIIQDELNDYKNKYNGCLNISTIRNLGGDCPLLYNDKSTMLRIDYNGNVYLCEGFCGQDFAIGNINNNKLIDILLGKKCVELLNFFRDRINIIDECKNCCLRNKFCLGGCVVDAYYRQADCLCTDGCCEIRFKEITKKLLKFRYQES